MARGAHQKTTKATSPFKACILVIWIGQNAREAKWFYHASHSKWVHIFDRERKAIARYLLSVCAFKG